MSQDSQTFQHVLVIEDGKYHRRIALDQPTYSVGRYPSNAVVINSQKASRRHATLIRKRDSDTDNYSYWLLDGDFEGNRSFNGIFVNGKRCLVTQLKHGDLVNFGCEINAIYYTINNCSESGISNDNKNVENFKPQSSRSTLVLDEKETKQISKHKTYQSSAYDDLLTDFPNRILWLEYLNTALKNAEWNSCDIAILIFELYQFHQLTQEHSQEFSELILQTFAQRLKTCFRDGDIVARWSEDSFAVLLPQMQEDIFQIKSRILQTLNQPYDINGKQINLICHVGTSVSSHHGSTETNLVETAKTSLKHEIQLYQKNQNKQQVSQFKVSKPLKNHVRHPQWSKIESRLQQALDREEFFLIYQPQIDVETNKISGLEALIRWQHPQKGSIPTRLFLPLIEKTEFSIVLGQWVLKAVSQQILTWQRRGITPLPVTVNLSSRQFNNCNLSILLSGILQKTGLPADLLELDITEKALLQDVNRSSHLLQSLTDLGIRLSLDDFGSGYASLSCLSQFPFSKLKISQHYIANLIDHPQEKGLISAAIAWGQSQNLRIVAEGVETQEQYDILRELNCKEMQGFFFHQPLTPDQLLPMLLKHSPSSTDDTQHKALIA